VVEPGTKVRLSKIDPSYKGKYETHEKAAGEIGKHLERLNTLQYLLYADGDQSLLVVLQALDAAGKDGVVRHVFAGMNPQGTSVFGFKQPSKEEAAHDFLWRAHLHTPGRGEVVIFNRSHYEDVLVVRVHKLARFAQRLEDPSRHWKISESDYSERKLWPQYLKAYEDAMASTSTKRAPWYVIPANHKWFRNLAVSQIIADTMDEMGLKLPAAQVDIADIRRKYHAAERAAKRVAKRSAKAAKTAG
jgi:polyphosphate kinase 2 (PPK2 family)